MELQGSGRLDERKVHVVDDRLVQAIRPAQTLRTWPRAARSRGTARRLRAAETAANPSTRPPRLVDRMAYLESGSSATPSGSASFAPARSFTSGGSRATTARPPLGR